MRDGCPADSADPAECGPARHVELGEAEQSETPATAESFADRG